MKMRGTGSRSFVLNDGVSVELDAERFGYEFPFVEEAELFVDAEVQVFAGTHRSAGSVVALNAGTIIVALESDFGPRIRSCVLRVDATALLVALAERLDGVEQRQFSFNTSLADAVVTGTAAGQVSDIASFFHPTAAKLPFRANQAEAIRRALRLPVFYLWGPPGTGKTHTLAALVGALFDANKRVLICSNTNRAVDQLLVNLCRQLGTAHPALAEGRVIRHGRVEPDNLREFAPYLITEKIVERLSVDLVERQRGLRAELAPIQEELERVDRGLVLFEELDSALPDTRALDEKDAGLLAAADVAREEVSVANAVVEEAERELSLWRDAGRVRRAFMHSEERLLESLAAKQSRATSLVVALDAAISAHAQAKSALVAHVARLAELKRQVASYDRLSMESTRAVLKSRKVPLDAELASVEAKLSDLERAVLAGAKVVGATVTKTYLSAKDLGRFDIVIVDEASMVPLPALYFAAGLASERVTISGDFNQLPAIVPTSQKAIRDIIGSDVFDASGIAEVCRRNSGGDPRVVMLDVQSRMDEPICALVRVGMEYRGLKTQREDRSDLRTLPAPYSGALTVIDTSRLWPFESRNLLSSRFNLMHTLLVRNLVWHFDRSGFVESEKSLGVCSPYAAEAKLLSELINGEPLAHRVTASTVHRYQGDERRAMILDVPESIGSGFNIGRFIQADDVNDDGAKLLNVALSRAQDHLIIVANLTYLDQKLPSRAKLRFYLFEIQRHGVVDAHEVLALRPIVQDLQHYAQESPAGPAFDETAVFFRQDSFDMQFRHDVAEAKKSVVIFSGFVTAQRIGAYGDLFRVRISDGVKIRCVTRPPQYNGTMDREESRRALAALEAIGVVVDTRKVIHEKVVLIDDEIGWFGSLNALSHTSNPDELMQRVVNKGWASKLATLLSISPTSAQEGEGVAARRENPPCRGCGGRMYYAKGRFGPYFKCESESCSRTQGLIPRTHSRDGGVRTARQ